MMTLIKSLITLRKEVIEEKLKNLTKCLIKCAGRAEKELNVVHAPKITGKRRYFRPDPEQLEQIDLISKLKVSIKKKIILIYLQN